jgi:hypothetical protein
MAQKTLPTIIATQYTFKFLRDKLLSNQRLM